MESLVALIPARAGSKRVAGKNVRPLGGHPLMAYSIAAALDSGVCASVIVSTDSEEYAAIAKHYGAEVPFMRPPAFAADSSADIDWVQHALRCLDATGRRYGAFAILRPTSPFRLPGTIQRAWNAFRGDQRADSLRAVEKCAQHPGKMWVIRGERLLPMMPFVTAQGNPWHSSPYQVLPEVYVQNASLEIARTDVARDRNTIAGETVMPFVTEGHEGFDINDSIDATVADQLVASGRAVLPVVRQPAWRLHGVS